MKLIVIDTGGMEMKHCFSCQQRTWWTLYNCYNIGMELVKQYFQCQWCKTKRYVE